MRSSHSFRLMLLLLLLLLLVLLLLLLLLPLHVVPVRRFVPAVEIVNVPSQGWFYHTLYIRMQANAEMQVIKGAGSCRWHCISLETEVPSRRDVCWTEMQRVSC